jgi:hypothetical protein
MIKTLSFFSLILFFSLFFTTKAVQNHISTTFMMPCEVNKDCHDAVTAEYIEYLKSYLEQVICMNGICRIIPL